MLPCRVSAKSKKEANQTREAYDKKFCAGSHKINL